MGAAVALLTILSFATAARAGVNETLRCLGLGWSDGYHSRSYCPPRGKHCVPIWTQGQTQGETYEALPSGQPTPAANEGLLMEPPGQSSRRIVPPSRTARPTAPLNR